jgi:hypothetical protein
LEADMTPDIHAEAEPTLTDSARQLLESAGADFAGSDAGESAQGPGPGDETVMTWARAM